MLIHFQASFTSNAPWACPLQGREKVNLIHAFTKWGFDVLVSDVDTVWMRNPIPYMLKVFCPC